jgi:valyl-tRNA synthetase
MTESALHEIPKVYDPKACEERWSSFWIEKGLFHADSASSKPKYSIVIPPPNVTGRLHMGHALNNTLQDILCRFQKLEGREVAWMPGVDHAGIATQSVVERQLFEQEGLTRHDIGREKLVERIWQWREEYGDTIVEQLKALGCSCDWDRLRFTLDEVCERAVRHTFYKMFQDGLIYRGLRLVNWDCELQTAVADDEVYHETVQGHFWHLRYPLKDPMGDDPRYLIVATTRPETMLGDTAVAVNPGDERYVNLIGRSVILPLLEREIPIIADHWADPEKGSGCVKITPAHDPNDYQVGLRQKLPMINVLHPDGKINENGGQFEGMDRYDARKAVVEALEEAGLLERVEEYETEVGHSDRSKTPIEPYLTEQWFVKMAGLAQSAMDAVSDGRVRFYPDRYARTYLDWLGEKRDWCIGRQLWWGHRIPIWYCETCSEEDLQKAFEGREDVCWVRSEDNQRWLICSLEEDLPENAIPGHSLEQDPDVLDTWFSSQLWPHSTMGWPEPPKELQGFLESFYPTNVLVTSRDIITLWVARMVMSGLYNMKEIPFHHVYIHPKILDGRGETMSKSKGNGVDPLDIIQVYGADALRFAMCYLTTETQDVRMPVEYLCPHCGHLNEQTKKNMKAPKVCCKECKKEFATQWAKAELIEQLGRGLAVSDRFEIGRNFCNKIWNAARFILQNDSADNQTSVEAVEDTWAEQWIRSRLADTLESVRKALSEYRFSEVGQLLYRFFWNDFCDWYVELAKPRQRSDEPGRKEHTARAVHEVLSVSLQLLHPIIPYITEELWNRLQGGREQSIMTSQLPDSDACQRDEAIEREVSRFQDVVATIRNIRGELNIPPGEVCDIRFRPSNPGDDALLRKYYDDMVFLTRIQPDLQAGADIEIPAASSSALVDGIEIALLWSEDVKGRELKRLKKNLEKLEGAHRSVSGKLSNEGFVNKAPADVVERERQRERQLADEIAALQGKLEQLG